MNLKKVRHAQPQVGIKTPGDCTDVPAGFRTGIAKVFQIKFAHCMADPS